MSNRRRGQQSLDEGDFNALLTQSDGQSEDWNGFILKHLDDLVYCCNLEGTCLYCSSSVTKWLGYTPEEIIGSRYTEWCHPDDVHFTGGKELLRNQKSIIELRVRANDGSFLWFEFALHLADEGQQNPRILAVGREITKRKYEETVLEETMRIARIGSWEWNVAEDRVALFDQLYHIFGIEKKDEPMSSAEILAMVLPSERERLIEAVGNALHLGHFDFEFQHEMQEGEYQYLHLRGIVTYNEDGQPVKISGTVQNITDRKLVERKLQETVERYNSLKKYNHDAVFSLDLNGHIINTNVMAEKLTGYKIPQMTGKRFSMFIEEWQLQDILSEAIADATIEKGIDKIKTKDGQEAEVLTTIAPIIINQKNVGFYIIAKDITEQKKLLIAKETAESTNKAKSEFLAMMSHEIRTPMNGVIGMTDLMLETTEVTDTQREYLEIIRKSGDTLLAIINDILDFAKIESGKAELHEEAIDLRKVISETLDIVMVRAKEKGLALDFTVSPDIPGTLLGDPERLKQVLLNLIGNAVKFTYTGGINVTVNRLSGKEKQISLRFAVRDTGIGIPKEKIPLLFEPFSQLDHFMTRSYEGTGLGLAITKKLVGLMGGEIWVEPQDGPGATFMFDICFKEKQGVTNLMRSDAQEQPQSKKLRILIAEDNEINQIVLQKMLERLGHFTTIVSNGQEVLQTIAYESFDMIFMDVHMPEMNGLEATEIIKRTVSQEKCPVIIAVTANALKGDRENCLRVGMDDYISKPIKSSVVTEVIGKYF
ncbi:PAS domain S-box-containing protein [Fontibacillus phaseoli]|uniref:Circadian input-output histidine kinase CikA n=1 Tax=Fontibacillus phaseoli TaxID=1416533 RepID=A0A369B7I1_9BACL|nr:PAS domain S-box protein [Fontibacillus phaseoli]RCX16506.1 PAS domain S-box-containing protein [Fontibacillus phaseoli]